MRKMLWLAAVLALLLSLTACSGEETPSPAVPEDQRQVTDANELEGKWSSPSGNILYFVADEGCYYYQTFSGRTGQGRYDTSGDVPMIDFDGFLYDFILRDDGVLLPNQNGSGDAESFDHFTFTRSDARVDIWDIAQLDGVWQNALGYTLAFDTQRMRVIECDINDTMSSSALYDWADGRGVFMGGAEVLHPCVSLDGNALVLFPDNGEPRDLDSRSTGVFYRNGDAAAYADLDNAACEESDGRIWYYDGVNYFAVPAGYTLNGDGQACDEDGKLFAPVWSQERYDPAAVWGENWLAENWGGNG